MPIQIYGNEISGLYLVRNTISTEASITATTSATGNTCISTGVFTVNNAGTYIVEVFTPYLTKGTTNLDIELFSGSSSGGTFITSLSGHMTASVGLGSGITFLAATTLAAGSNQLTVTGFVDAGTGKFGANNGATGNAPNAMIGVRGT